MFLEFQRLAGPDVGLDRIETAWLYFNAKILLRGGSGFFPAIELDLVFNAIQTFQIPIDETDHYLAWFCVIAVDVI